MARNASLDSSALDITSATSRLVALTKQGAVDPEISLAILLELRAQLHTIGQLLDTRRTDPAPMWPARSDAPL